MGQQRLSIMHRRQYGSFNKVADGCLLWRPSSLFRGQVLFLLSLIFAFDFCIVGNLIIMHEY